MYQRIVVPMDESATALAAFQEAIKLAKITGARLFLLHVEDISRSALAPVGLPGMEYIDYGESHEANVAHSKQYLHELSEQAVVAGVECESRVLEKFGGNAAKAVLEVASHLRADLIVMGTHGYSGFMHLIFGSTAESLLHHAKIPVLMVRHPEEDDDE
ncbi:universal stress protein [Chitinibacter bivalviorum]|uniref:Universal stress protein n=1 Tax=Chitinibacter bivalviorum TaxID=2739434 RepID=A0A7H9BLH6_9NEIS|nr:universal stress protein [Chitinibacter bivalviorum]QLG89138.1 universal stress protein [Chitinibacter bivalviorum]